MNTAIFPILGYALTSDTRSLSELRELADFRLKPELNQIPGVSQVQVEGGTRREFQVRLDPQRLAGRKISASQVVEAIRRNDTVLSAGLVESNHELYLTLVTGKPSSLESLSRIAVPAPAGGIPVSLAELGTVAAADAVAYIHTTADRKPAVLVNVIRQPGASTLAIAAAVDDLVPSPERHPAEGRPVDPVLRPGRVRPGVGRRRARRHPHRRGPRGPGAAGVSAELQDRGDRDRHDPGDGRHRASSALP